jgi:hypothetical protein
LAWTGWIGVIGGIATVAAAIEEDLRGRLPAQHKKQRAGLALLAATMLDVRSANLMDLAASLPRAAERLDMRYQWISRLLGNARIGVEAEPRRVCRRLHHLEGWSHENEEAIETVPGGAA